MSKTCKKRLTCHFCEKKHPTVLHIKNFTPEGNAGNIILSTTAKKETIIKSNPVTMAMVSTEQTGTKDYKLAVVPVKVKANKGGCVIETYAFLDPRSTATFCTEKLMEQVSVRGKKTEILLRMMGNERLVKTHRLGRLEVCSLDGNNLIELPEVFTQNAIPVSQENIYLPNNREMAEPNIQKDEAFWKDYISFMNDVLVKGCAERVPEEQLLRNDGRLWYIPHHGIYHKRKKTIWMVFDCTSLFQGTSLNSEQLQGPDLTNTFYRLLLMFYEVSREICIS